MCTEDLNKPIWRELNTATYRCIKLPTRHAEDPYSKQLCACLLSHFSHVRLFETPQTVALQAPLSMGFSRQEYQSGLPFPSPGDLPHPGIEPASPASPALAGEFLTAAPGCIVKKQSRGGRGSHGKPAWSADATESAFMFPTLRMVLHQKKTSQGDSVFLTRMYCKETEQRRQRLPWEASMERGRN